MVKKWLDSYDHYRDKVGLGILLSIWRATHYEITGRDR